MSSQLLIIASAVEDLPELKDRVIAADQYLGSVTPAAGGVTVVNLCRSYRYRSKGYYVSLIADARGHRVLPAIETLEELSDSFGLFRVLREAGIPTLDVADMRGAKQRDAEKTEVAETLAIFGETSDPMFQRAADAAYRAWPIPVLRLRFVRKGEEWWVASAEPLPLRKMGAEDRAKLVRMLCDEGSSAIERVSEPAETKRASIAVLYDDEGTFSPSSPQTIEHLADIAASMNIYLHPIGLDELDRLGEYDALFIRTLTGVREPAFQFALRAEMLDMPVIDDPQSIIRCSNKVFLEELLRREGIPTPRTMIVSTRTTWSEISTLGTPLVVKLPDGSFSAAVHKVDDPAQYAEVTGEMFRRSPLLIAQEFIRTDFDWRVAVLNGQVLFTARYFMASGHWQIRTEDGEGARFGQVEAIPREEAPRAVVELARRASALIGRGLYGVDIKETAAGPVVIEVNDNPNIDLGEEDGADGDRVYRDILDFFVRRIEETPREESVAARSAHRVRTHYRPFSVAGIELEYAVVDAELNPVSLVEEAFRQIAGKTASDVEVGAATFSNEIADHVFEVKTTLPTRSLAKAEEILVEGVQRFSEVLDEKFGARLLPTGMHPWMDPTKASLWQRSGQPIYEAYSRIFDVHTHGWLNVHATHVNLPMGRGHEAVAMYNATVLLIPYLPALAASSPVHDGLLQESADNRMEWIFRHQSAIPESQGEILPEYITSIGDYRRRILQPMYDALDGYPGGELLKHEFFNARGAVLKQSRRSLEIRVIDTQECVKLDIAIAVFVRAVLRHYTRRLLAGRQDLPPRQILLADLRSTIRRGSESWVVAPHFGDTLPRDAEGRASVKSVLIALANIAERNARQDELPYIPLVRKMIESGSLSERIRAALQPHDHQPEALRSAIRRIYGELADSLLANVPWAGRGFSDDRS